VGDLNGLDLTVGPFDAAVAFDSLYFAEDLGKTVGDIMRLLFPGGRLFAFYAAYSKDQVDPADFEPCRTQFGLALASRGLGFETIDFTANDHRVWQHVLRCAQAKKPKRCSGVSTREGRAGTFTWWPPPDSRAHRSRRVPHRRRPGALLDGLGRFLRVRHFELHCVVHASHAPTAHRALNLDRRVSGGEFRISAIKARPGAELQPAGLLVPKRTLSVGGGRRRAPRARRRQV
jgi:SAM-dependent methyltransferase